jgi:small subunit ribosomal protein S16
VVRIRLARAGLKKHPFYHIVATDSRSARDGRFIEQLGYFNPTALGKEIKIHLELDQIEQWLSQGAQISDRVKRLITEYKKAPPST